MKCNKNMQELLSVWLDGELNPVEAVRVERHLGECAACREDLAIWREIRSALSREPVEITAPEGFAAGVMARLPASRKSWWQTLTGNWRRSLAAAAASLLIAVGGIGAAMYSGVFTGAQVVDSSRNQVAANDSEINGITLPPDDKTSYQSNPVNPNNQDNPDSNNATTGGTPQLGNTENNGPVTGDTGVSTVKNDGTTSTPEILALLNVEKERVIRTTLIMIRADNPDEAGVRVAGLAGEYKATHRVMESQVTATGKRQAFELLVEREKADRLMKDLEALGQVIMRDGNSKDISRQYNEQVELYQSLDAQLQNAAEDEKQPIILKMSGIENQLRAWDRESSMHKIILWLES